MKNLKLFLFLFVSICSISVLVTSCKKEVSSDVTTDESDIQKDADGYAYDYLTEDADEVEPIELEERGITLFKIDSIVCATKFKDVSSATTPFQDAHDANCTSHPLSNYSILWGEDSYTISGTGFGTSKGSSTITATFKKTPVEINISSWSNNKIIFYFDASPQNAPKGSFKITIVNPNVPKDSTKSSPSKFVSKTKSKSIKALSVLNYNNKSFFTMGGEVAKQWITNKSSDYSTKTFANITSTYTPQLGDILMNGTGRLGSVISISGTSIKVSQRNSQCKGELKTGTWKYTNGLFSAKDGTTWSKFIQ